jgi:RNA polymerase sigma-70 factor (ECF subfamily)
VANALSRIGQLVPPVEITTPLVDGAVAARTDPGGEFDTVITSVVAEAGPPARTPCATRTSGAG